MKHIEEILIGIISLLLALIVIIATDFWLLWLPLAHSPEYPQKVSALFMALTALVTLLVVYATFYATKQSNLREETRRVDEIEKEKRDRKERLLNEIIEWAIEVPSFGLKEYSNFSSLTNNTLGLLREYNRSNLFGFQALNIKGEHVENITHIFYCKKLEDAVKELRKELKQYIEDLKENGGKIDFKEDSMRRTKLNEYTIKVLEAANEINAKLLE